MNEITEANLMPAVFAQDGRVLANSRHVAEVFGKEHRNVLRDIDTLIKQEPSLAPAHFCAGVYTPPSTGWRI